MSLSRWALFLFLVLPAAAQVQINEFLASNELGILDDDGEYSDWIEIKNVGTAPVNLDGYSLTDDPGIEAKFRFPSRTLGANQLLIVFASGKDRAPASGALHTSFKLDSGGGTLILETPDRKTNSVTYPPQARDVSYGRLGTAWKFFSPPSPGLDNKDGASGVSIPPAILAPSGVYLTNVVVTFSNAPGSTVRYTLNGSDPGTSSAVLSGNRLTITNSAQLRAKAFQADRVPSPTVTRVYSIMGTDLTNFSSPHPLIVLHTYGRAINESQKTVSGALYIEPFRGRTYLTNAPQHAGRGTIKIRGSSSATFAQKSYAIETLNERGREESVSLLGLPEESDWVLYAPYLEPTLMRNVLAFQLARDLGMEAPRTKFVEVFLDESGSRLGSTKYAGLYVLMEKIKRGKNRVNVEKLRPSDVSEPAISGGYIFKKDRLDPGDVGFSTGPLGGAFCYVEPSEQQITPVQKTWLAGYLAEYESALSGPNFTNRDTGYRKYIDVRSFIDFHLFVEMTRNIDGHRLSTYYYKDRGGKLFCAPLWDFNFSLGNPAGITGDQTNGWYWPIALGLNGYAWYPALFLDPDFTQEYVDRYGEARAGVFSTTNLMAQINSIAASINEAQDRNFKRWPGQTSSYAGTLDTFRTWVTLRMAWMDLNTIPPPRFGSPPGKVAPGTMISLSNAPGITFFTLDGTDPRPPGGAGPAPGASAYAGPIAINQNVRLFARTFTGSNVWSPPAVGTFYLAAPPVWLTEIMHHPAGVPKLEEGPRPAADDFSFIELKNGGSTPLDFKGVRISGGIDFTFATNWVVPAGGYALLVRNRAVFETRYGNTLPVAGEFSGKLDSGKDRIRIEGALQEPILDIQYDGGWFPITQYGFSLVPKVEGLPAPAAGSEFWRPGAKLHGSPGSADGTPISNPPIVISELLANSDPPLEDYIELENPTDSPVDVSNWLLSDDPGKTSKFRLPSGSVIPAQGHLVVYESDFGQGSGFSLSSQGEEAFLFSADPFAKLTGYVNSRKFGATASGAALGTYSPLSGGEPSFVPLEQRTPGRPNWGFRRSPLVISEVMYHPPDVVNGTNRYERFEDEYIVLHNASTNTIDLSGGGTNKYWRLEGAVEFEFPANFSLAPDGYVVVVSFASTNLAEVGRFKQKYKTDSARIAGPFQGRLADTGEALRLMTAVDTNRWMLSERIDFQPSAPWPGNASGTGKSIRRRNELEFADDPANWAAIDPAPGKVFAPSASLAMSAQPQSQTASPGGAVEFRAALAGAAPRTYQWRRNRVAIPGATQDTFRIAAVSASDAGTYDVVVRAGEGSISSQEAVLSIFSGPVDTDGDGLPDDWETRYDLDPGNAADARQDADQDGFDNLSEFLAGTDPRNPASALRISRVSWSSGAVTLEFAVVAGRRYALESAGAPGGSWDSVREIDATSTGPITQLVSASSSARFYRIRLLP